MSLGLFAAVYSFGAATAIQPYRYLVTRPTIAELKLSVADLKSTLADVKSTNAMEIARVQKENLRLSRELQNSLSEVESRRANAISEARNETLPELSAPISHGRALRLCLRIAEIQNRDNPRGSCKAVAERTFDSPPAGT